MLALPPSQSPEAGVAVSHAYGTRRAPHAEGQSTQARTVFTPFQACQCAPGRAYSLVLVRITGLPGRRWTAAGAAAAGQVAAVSLAQGQGPEGGDGPDLARGGRAVPGCRPLAPGVSAVPRAHRKLAQEGSTGSSRPARRCLGLSKVQTWPWPHQAQSRQPTARPRAEQVAGGVPGRGARATGRPAFLPTAPRALEQPAPRAPRHVQQEHTRARAGGWGLGAAAPERPGQCECDFLRTGTRATRSKLSTRAPSLFPPVLDAYVAWVGAGAGCGWTAARKAL